MSLMDVLRNDIGRRDFSWLLSKFLGASIMELGIIGCSLPQKRGASLEEVMEPLAYLKEISQSLRYTEGQFIKEISARLENEDISAIILGEEHWIDGQKKLGYEILKSAFASSKKILGFFDETYNWDRDSVYMKDTGIFAAFLERQKLLNGKAREIKEIYGVPYYRLNPMNTHEVGRALSGNGIVISYTGNMHADSMYKNYMFRFLEPDIVDRHDIKTYPTIGDEVERIGKKKITVLMHQSSRLLEVSEMGLKKILGYSNEEAKRFFFSKQKRLLRLVEPGLVYKINSSFYVFITNETEK